MAFDVDFFVIGAGSGGVRAARIAAMHGAKTIVAEESRIGGTCVIRGCVPKKLYVYASRFADDFADAAGFGWSVGAPTFDWPSLVAAKEKEITRLSAAYRANLAASGAELIEERATVVGPHRVRLASGREVSARHILVAVGSWPTLLPGVEGLEHTITSNEAFDLPVFPRRLLVVGGGYIGVEFASLFRRLGAEVVHVMRASNVLRGFDDDMREGMRAAMARAGVVHRFGILPYAHREAARRRAPRHAGERRNDRRRPGPRRDRSIAQYRGAWPRERRIGAQPARLDQGRRESDQRRVFHPRRRRRHSSRQSDARRDSRGSRFSQLFVRAGPQTDPLRYDRACRVRDAANSARWE